MQDLTAKRTLVKSPPELWSELSEVERLAKHLDPFGEIKITRLEPERTVAWEGEGASGTVSIEPSGWGTKVTLTARVEGEDPVPEPPAPEPPALESPAREAPALDPEPAPAEPVGGEPAPEPIAQAQTPRPGLFARLFGRERRRPAMAAEAPVWVAGAPEPEAVEPEPVVEPEPLVEERVAEEPVVEPEPLIEERVAEDRVVSEPVAEQQSVAAEPQPQPEPEPVEGAPITPTSAQAALESALEALGSAHHRPFSRG
jgi:hypothetical protein